MASSPSPSPAEIIAALQRGGIVEALKLVLAAKRDGSSAARNLASRVARESKPLKSEPASGQAGDLSPGEVPRSNNDVWILVLIGALCIAYHVFAR